MQRLDSLGQRCSFSFKHLTGWPWAMPCHGFTCHARPCPNFVMPHASTSCHVMIILSKLDLLGPFGKIFPEFSTHWDPCGRSFQDSGPTGNLVTKFSGFWAYWDHLERYVQDSSHGSSKNHVFIWGGLAASSPLAGGLLPPVPPERLRL